MKASLKNHTAFTNHKKGKKIKPPDEKKDTMIKKNDQAKTALTIIYNVIFHYQNMSMTFQKLAL